MRLLLLFFLPVVLCMKCMNYYGLETESYDLVCSWKHQPWWYLDRLKNDMNIDTLRIPFSAEYVSRGNFTNLDALMIDSQRVGFRVILDYHRTNSSHQSKHPGAESTLREFVDVWTTIIDRYLAYPNLWAVDLFNEPQDVDAEWMNVFNHRLVSTLEFRYSGRLVYILSCPEWGSDCRNIDLDIPGVEPARVKVGIHLYPFTSGALSLDSLMSKHIPANRWVVGETGYNINDRQHAEWFSFFVGYLKKRNVTDVCLWTIAHSSDTGGWFDDNCETLLTKKVQALTPLWGGVPTARRVNQFSFLDKPHVVNRTETGGKHHGLRVPKNNTAINQTPPPNP